MQSWYEDNQFRWALERADFRNAHFNADGVGWLPEDFLGRGNREERAEETRQARVEEGMAKMQVNALNASIAAMNETSDPRALGVPLWAIEAEENAQKRKAGANGRTTG